VTRGEFAAFVDATGYDAKGERGSYIYVDRRFVRDPDADWRRPGFDQTDDDPVVCTSYYDALAYASWLSEKTGHTYRLPSEAEWEYAVRGGTTTLYPWGTELGLGHANCDGCTAAEAPLKPTRGGTFPPNGFGLYDVCGNVWKWLADCWNPTYVGAPTDGSAWETGNRALRGRRGGSWFNVAERLPDDIREPYRLRSAARFGSIPELRYSSFGFRVVRAL
jgi:formylglycine-generating enzyme required for sulfatase activity